MSVLQIVGTLLAIPVGIGSAYSMYRANFSAEATCQSLRANIVVMLDKSVDASTRHMLVRRDVEAFQRSCGAVDPDATAAFKAVLAAEKPAAPAATASVRRAEPQPQPQSETVARKAEPHAAVAAKQPAATTTPPAAETEPVKRDVAASDAVWLAAVRSALVARGGEPAAPAEHVAATSPAPLTPPATRPLAREAHSLGELPAQPPIAAAPAPAPALPPATAVAIVPAPQPDVDHPVPPEAIPEIAAGLDGHPRSRFSKLVAQIPFFGQSLDAKIDGASH